MNNSETLMHIEGPIWITKPLSEKPTTFQHINVCVQSADNDYVAVDHLRLEPSGHYYSKSKDLGRIDDGSFRDYIRKLSVNDDGIDTGELSGMDEISAVCHVYEKTHSIAVSSRKTGVPEKKLRRILISKGLYTTKISEQVNKMWNAGNTYEEIESRLHISRDTIRSYLPLDLGDRENP